jgi:hypothetical protein
MERQMVSVIEREAGTETVSAAGTNMERAASTAEPREFGRYLCAAAGGPGSGADPFKPGPAPAEPSGMPDLAWGRRRDLQLEFPDLFGNQAERPPPGTA